MDQLVHTFVEGIKEMLTAVSFDRQYARATSGPRILVVGAGIAGITVTQLLRRYGLDPVLIERSGDGGNPGYMLALMPMIDPVIDDLGIREDYRSHSQEFGRYALSGHTGRRLRIDSITGLLERFGEYRGLGRGELIKVLTGDGCELTQDTTVSALTETPDHVTARLNTGGTITELIFDLVIISDGINSTTRDLISPKPTISIVDTGWSGWVAWAPADANPDVGDELWGAGFFLGVYPVAGALGVFLGGPRDDLAAGPADFVASVRHRLRRISPRFDLALDAVAGDPDPYLWPMTDGRASRWTTGRTVLLGDAAAGFLPTAGIGAGMAMESAWMLARMLRHTHEIPLEQVLTRYEHTQRRRVEAAQDTSRQLAKLLFRRGRAIAVARDLAARAMSLQSALGPIQDLLATQPDPDREVDNPSAIVTGR